MRTRILFFVLTVAASTNAQFTQQGNKLVGTGAVGSAHQGRSVSLSSDGNTAIVGGSYDNNNAGAAWVFTRSGGEWSQQGNKLVGTGAVGVNVWQGNSVSISSDGNTAIVGGAGDNSSAGAVWVFTRSGSVWSQQGSKLVGTGATSYAGQGNVSISSDGNTAIVGGQGDNSNAGAMWVFTRSGGVWSQQGGKLVGTGAVGSAGQGVSVSISSDGNTAIVGGPSDNNNAGAVWVFTRSGGVWSQQGSKLVGTGAVGGARQGSSVSISSDGNTAIVGGYLDNSNAGAVWVFTRNGGVWSQQGDKLVGTGTIGSASQGSSVSISSNGNTAIVGGRLDNVNAGAAWVFTRSAGVWSQLGNKLVGTGAVGIASQGTVSISSDGNTAIVGGQGDDSNVGAVWVYANALSGFREEEKELPTHFSLDQNHPNPFNPTTVVSYQLPVASDVRLEVYDMLGREVAVLVNERREAGVHEVRFDASTSSSGVYLCRLTAGSFVQSRKLILLR